jgi:DNA polymerase III subunit delta'
MAKRSAPQDNAAVDCITAALHPRLTRDLIGQDDALAAVSRAIRGGRPPQAWLFCGSPGIGKATLAYRAARYLLTFGATADGSADLSVAEKSIAAAQVSAGSHPGLFVLKRGINPQSGKLMNVLSVDEVRKLGTFFGMTSGGGGWRIALVDTADDMNGAAANALLKMLEEPPARAMLLLLANAPGKILPTIRSRCRRLALRPLNKTDFDAALRGHLPEIADAEQETLFRLSAGSPGAAMRIAGTDGIMIAEAADKLIEQAATPDVPALFALADKLARIDDGFDKFGAFLLSALVRRICARAVMQASGLSRWGEAHDRLRRRFDLMDALYLDPRQTVLGAARQIGAAIRSGGAV